MHAKIIKPKNLSLDLLSDFREALSFTDFVRELKSFPEPPEWRLGMENTGTRRPHEPVERSFSGMDGKPGYDPLKRRRFGCCRSRCGFEGHPAGRKWW